MKIELIYFNGCPNINLARENIKKALADIGDKIKWDEWEQSDPNAPDYIRQYGSPTILVNGKDVVGSPSDTCSANSCRLYENGSAPSIDIIKSAINSGGCCS